MRFAAALLAVILFAQPSLAEPLSPGRPAGVKAARLTSSQEIWMLSVGALVMIGVGILASNGVGSDVLGTQAIPANQIPIAPVSTTGTSG